MFVQPDGYVKVGEILHVLKTFGLPLEDGGASQGGMSPEHLHQVALWLGCDAETTEKDRAQIMHKVEVFVVRFLWCMWEVEFDMT